MTEHRKIEPPPERPPSGRMNAATTALILIFIVVIVTLFFLFSQTADQRQAEPVTRASQDAGEGAGTNAAGNQ